MDIPPAHPYSKEVLEPAQKHSSLASAALWHWSYCASVCVLCGDPRDGLFRAVSVEVVRPAEVTATIEAKPALAPSAEMSRVDWQMTDKGPVVSDFLSLRLNLRAQRVEDRSCTAAAFQKYLEIESKYREQEKPEPNRVVTRIKPFQSEFKLLEHQVWTQLDQILSPLQQSQARTLLPLRPLVEPDRVFLDRLVEPGILGWGGEEVRIEIQQMGSWFQWRVVRGSDDSASSGRNSRRNMPLLAVTERKPAAVGSACAGTPCDFPVCIPTAGLQPKLTHRKMTNLRSSLRISYPLPRLATVKAFVSRRLPSLSFRVIRVVRGSPCTVSVITSARSGRSG